MDRILRWLTASLVFMALAAGIFLLANDANIGVPLGLSAAAISAAPLLLVGVAFLLFQNTIKPRWSELLRNMLLAGTFILWGVVQLMPRIPLSERLGNLVIALYVLDLSWVILARLASAGGDSID
jgi:hypothetical protein